MAIKTYLIASEHILRGIYIIQLLPIFKLLILNTDEIILQICKGPHATIQDLRIFKLSDVFVKKLSGFRINIIMLCHMTKNDPENNTDEKQYKMAVGIWGICFSKGNVSYNICFSRKQVSLASIHIARLPPNHTVM